MLNAVRTEAEDRMSKAIDALKKEFSTLRAGRATPSLLDKVSVEYYGAPTPINQMANVSAPEARLLVIQPWDKSVLPDIEKAIMKSDLGLTPNSDGIVIRLGIPQLTEERRSDLVKVVKKKGEEAKVAIRNIRRDANDQLKDLLKDGEVSEDENRKGQEDVQKITDRYIKDIDTLVDKKEQEIMEV